MPRPTPIACSLGESQKIGRTKLTAQLGERMLAVEAGGQRAVLRFPAERRESIEGFVRSESACCPFFAFDVVQSDGLVELRVSAPAGGEWAVRGLVAGFVAGWRALV